MGVISNRLWPDSVVVNLVGKHEHGNHGYVLLNSKRNSGLDVTCCWTSSSVRSGDVIYTGGLLASTRWLLLRLTSPSRSLLAQFVQRRELSLWRTVLFWVCGPRDGCRMAPCASFTFVHREVGGAFGGAELNSQVWELEWKQWETKLKKEFRQGMCCPTRQKKEESKLEMNS